MIQEGGWLPTYHPNIFERLFSRLRLPESFGELKQLEILDIASNQLKVLPESLLELPLLNRLNLFDNPIEKTRMNANILEQLKKNDVDIRI